MPTEKFNRLTYEERQRIIDAAVNEIISRGFDDATLSNIAERAGISSQLLKEYFQDRDDILNYTTNWVMEFWEEKINSYFNISKFNDMSTEGILAESFESALNWGQKYARYARFGMKLFYEMDFTHPLRVRYSKRGTEQMIEFCQHVIQRGQQRGEVRNDIHPRVAAFWLFAMMMYLSDASLSSLLDLSLGMQSEEACEVANATLDLLLRGIESPSLRTEFH